jgi:hypothetical protein
MRDLSGRVNARVGFDRAADFNLSRKQLVSGDLQFALHGFRVVLDLPAAIARAFVFNFEFPSGHFDLMENGKRKIENKVLI